MLSVENALKLADGKFERSEAGSCRSRTGSAPSAQHCEAAVHHGETWLISTKMTMPLMVGIIQLLLKLITPILRRLRNEWGMAVGVCLDRGQTAATVTAGATYRSGMPRHTSPVC